MKQVLMYVIKSRPKGLDLTTRPWLVHSRSSQQFGCDKKPQARPKTNQKARTWPRSNIAKAKQGNDQPFALARN